MAEQQELDAAIQALDQAAEEDGARAMPRLRAAVEALRAEGDADRLAWALPPFARALALSDHMQEAEAVALEALAHFRGIESARGQAFALNALGVVNVCRGIPSRALDYTGEAVVLARAADDAVLQVRIANTLGTVLNDMGRLPDAVQVLEEGLRAVRGFPHEPVVLRLRTNLSLALARWALKEYDERAPAGNWRERAQRSIEVLRPAIDHWRAAGRTDQISGVLDNLAIAYLVLGRLADAHAALDEAEALVDPAEASYSMVFFCGVRARVHLQAGEPDRALEAITRGLTAADNRGGHIYIDELHRLKSLAHEARGEFREALIAHKRYHELRTRVVLERAEQQASALAVALDTERALRQVSEERERAEHAHREARHDALTGLANRRRFDEFLAGMLPRATAEHPISLVLVDLDHFKLINDQHRHVVGDDALRWVATHLQAQSRQSDLPARLGGDEFALVLTAPIAVAHQVCNRLRVAVAQPSPDLPPGLTIRLSAGIAETQAPCDIHHLYKRADDALYAAKASGRDAIRHDALKDAP